MSCHNVLKTVVFICLLALIGQYPTFAQSLQFRSRAIIASDYGKWYLESSDVIVSGAGKTVTVFMPSTPITAADGAVITPIRTTRKFRIVDGAASETVTSTSVNCPGDGSVCSITATFSNAHGANGKYRVQSGTAGVQEAIDSVIAIGPNPGGFINITPDFTGTTANFTTDPIGSTTIVVKDVRAGENWYTWNGSAYVSVLNLNSSFVGFAPATATYVLQTANAGLSNAQVLGSLGTGIVKVTTTTGLLSSGAACADLTNGAASCSTDTTIATNITSGTLANARLVGSGTITLNGSTLTLGGTTTLMLASSNFVNQGTTTTVLHGNAAGNPAFGQVVNADLQNSSITIQGSSVSLGGSTLATSSTPQFARLGLGAVADANFPLLAKSAFTGFLTIQIQNTAAGTGNGSELTVGADADAAQLYIQSFSSTYTTSGMSVQSGSVVDGEGPGGLSIAATQAPIRFYTNGSTSANERMRIDTSGNIGIGTTTPGYANSVLGNNFLSVVNLTNNDSGVVEVGGAITSAATNVGYFAFVVTGNTDSGASTRKLVADIQATVPSPATAGALGADMVFFTKPDNGARAEVARFLSAGGEQLGSASGSGVSSGAKLILNGWNATQKNWQIDTAFVDSQGISFTPSTASGGLTFTTSALNIADSGSFTFSGVGPHGIGGTTNSSIQLYLQGSFTPASGGAVFQIGSIYNTVASQPGYGLYVGPTIVSAGSGTHAFLGNRVALSHTTGAATVTDVVAWDISSFATNSNTTTATGLRVAAPTAASTNWAISVTSGNVNLTGKLFDSGLTNANAQDYVCYNTSTKELEQNVTTCNLSSERFKHGITDIQFNTGAKTDPTLLAATFTKLPATAALSAFAVAIDTHPATNLLNQIHPVNFFYNADVATPDLNHSIQQFGFIAEEVLPIEPRLVTFETDGVTPHSVRYLSFIPILTQAQKENSSRLDAIEARLAAAGIK